ncbi:uncharacterized protein LOC119599528 isoform X2 [Penaeus monodon]|uniref:uncharacterized protein LOC119599528 isoform X2 n=1 Tax=Penaeus monodon TaxID=6687 RepID=UPI0018A78946|nr:uncharacterized protein LOC119599528 isoform X2 [Penaeus monodon]
MLRESSVTYASLPQEEGSPQAEYITTRSIDSPHTRRDCHLAAVITTFVIVIGVSLAVILPLTLRGAQDASGRDDESADLLWSHISQLGQQLVDKERIPDEGTAADGAEDAFGNHTDDPDLADLPEQPKLTTAEAILPVNADSLDHKEDEADNPKPVSTTPAPVLTVHDGQYFSNGKGEAEEGGGEVEGGAAAEVDTETAEGGGEPSSDFSDTDTGSEGEASSGSNDEENAASGAEGGENGQDAAPMTTAPPVVTYKPTPTHVNAEVQKTTLQQAAVTPPGPASTLSRDELFDQIFGAGNSVKPGTVAGSSWMNDVLGAEDEVTVTVLAVVVAIAMAAVLAATICLVYSRVKARRRRIRIHNVITDLQSRDKIVLMNSDESEEE